MPVGERDVIAEKTLDSLIFIPKEKKIATFSDLTIYSYTLLVTHLTIF